MVIAKKKALVLPDRSDRQYVIAAFRAGASGYLSRDCSLATLNCGGEQHVVKCFNGWHSQSVGIV